MTIDGVPTEKRAKEVASTETEEDLETSTSTARSKHHDIYLCFTKEDDEPGLLQPLDCHNLLSLERGREGEDRWAKVAYDAEQRSSQSGQHQQGALLGRTDFFGENQEHQEQCSERSHGENGSKGEHHKEGERSWELSHNVECMWDTDRSQAQTQPPPLAKDFEKSIILRPESRRHDTWNDSSIDPDFPPGFEPSPKPDSMEAKGAYGTESLKKMKAKEQKTLTIVENSPHPSHGNVRATRSSVKSKEHKQKEAGETWAVGQKLGLYTNDKEAVINEILAR